MTSNPLEASQQFGPSQPHEITGMCEIVRTANSTHGVEGGETKRNEHVTISSQRFREEFGFQVAGLI